jgi:hypothetical protein
MAAGRCTLCAHNWTNWLEPLPLGLSNSARKSLETVWDYFGVDSFYIRSNVLGEYGFAASDCIKRRAVVIGTFMCLMSVVGIYWAAEAEVVPSRDVVGFSIFMTTGLVISSILAYFVRKKLSQRGAVQQRGHEQN